MAGVGGGRGGQQQWWTKAPKNPLFNAFSWYGFPKPAFEVTKADGQSVFLAALKLPAAIRAQVLTAAIPIENPNAGAVR